MVNDTQHTSSRRRTGAAEKREHAGARLLLALVDCALAGVIFIAPWFMGGRHPLGELVLVTLAVAAAAAWTLRQCLTTENSWWRRSPIDLVVLAAVCLVLLQLAPLPHGLLNVLAPHTDEVLPMWTAGSGSPVQLGTWTQISLTPESTKGSLAVLLAFGLFALVAVQRIERVEDVERLLRWLAISVSIFAVVGLVQYLAGNGKFLWIYEHPFRDTYDAVKGPFINRNHFGHLMALGIGPLIWWIQRGAQTRRRGGDAFGQTTVTNQHAIQFLQFLALGLVLFAGLMTLSRGGAMAIGVAAIFCGAALVWRGMLNRKLALATLATFVLMGTALGIHGYGQVTDRLQDYTAGSIKALDKAGIRRSLWKADATALGDFYRVGSGIASHREVYPMYFDKFVDEEMTHAENGYLQIALEAGVPGVMLLAVALVLVGSWCLSGLRSQSKRIYLCSAAVGGGLAASVLHSLGDFVWYIPSLMAITILLTACGFRLSQFAAEEHAPAPVRTVDLPRWLPVSACAVVLGLGMWMVDGTFRSAMASGHWDAFIKYKLAPGNWLREDVPDELIAHVEQILAWTPRDARAQIRYSDLCLQRFNHVQLESDNQLGVHDFCDAAMASKFPSRAALDQWLTRAAGENRRYLESAWRHTRLGLALCPLQGVGYTHLAELCFLEGGDLTTKSSYLAQALRVRPNDGKVLLVAGGEAFVQQKFDESLALWKRAFESGPENRQLLIDFLASKRVHVGLLLGFKPDFEATRAINVKYSELRDPQQNSVLLNYYAKAGEQAIKTLEGAEAAKVSLELRDVYERLEQPDNVLACLERANELLPNDFAIRKSLGMCLSEQGEFGRAESHLQWCLQRQPESKPLQAAVAKAVKGRLSQPSARSARSNANKY